MSIECGECEHDLRGGHATTCSRAKPKLTHTGHKNYEQIKAQCKQLGITLNDKLYKEGNSDFVFLEGGGARVYYSSFNGRFFGTTDLGVEFSSDSTEHDHEPWFQTLLDFFLEGRKEPTT